jgi:acetyl-CoA carboxylase carboxyl transferase subunit beta
VDWFRRKKAARPPVTERKLQVPQGIWRKCDACKEVLYAKAIEQNGQACPRCDFHFPIAVEDRLALLMDPGTVEEIELGLTSVDPLKFKDLVSYKDRLRKYREKSGREDAVVVVRGQVLGHALICCVMDFGFLGGSLGSVVGEKITRAAERAAVERLPLVVICASGGARMQEGALSLMQMAKVNAALARLDDEGLPYVAVLTNPTTGGVTASFAMVADVCLAEPGALIGFAGPRVIEQTIGQKLPEGFQRSEFLLEHGMVDLVVSRRVMRPTLGRILTFLTGRPSQAVEAAVPSREQFESTRLPRVSGEVLEAPAPDAEPPSPSAPGEAADGSEAGYVAH